MRPLLKGIPLTITYAMGLLLQKLFDFPWWVLGEAVLVCFASCTVTGWLLERKWPTA